MKKILLPLIVFLFISVIMMAQETTSRNHPYSTKSKHGILSISWGYNLDWYSKSDIHFKDKRNGLYDFVIEDAIAKDRPGLSQIFYSDLAIPQYAFRIGYLTGKNRDWGFEINYDHSKYVVVDGQTVHIKGNYFGEYLDNDTIVGKPFLAFEHTNGANFFMFMAMKRQTLLHDKKQNHWLSAIGRIGGGFVFPRTDATINGNRRDDQFHIAGYIAGVDIGVRYDFYKYFFLENEVKGSFVNYTSALLPYAGRANHHFWAFEYILTFGVNVNL